MQKERKKELTTDSALSCHPHTIPLVCSSQTSNYKQTGSEDFSFIQSGTNTEAQLPHTFVKRKKYMLKRKQLQPSSSSLETLTVQQNNLDLTTSTAVSFLSFS